MSESKITATKVARLGVWVLAFLAALVAVQVLGWIHIKVGRRSRKFAPDYPGEVPSPAAEPRSSAPSDTEFSVLIPPCSRRSGGGPLSSLPGTAPRRRLPPGSRACRL
jgi:hypothetical protein